MVYSPVFTNTAENTYFELIDYLNKNYGDRAVASFVQNTITTLEYIATAPMMFPESSIHWKYRRALIDRFTSIYYSIVAADKQVVIHLFWHNQRNPNYLAHFLSKE